MNDKTIKIILDIQTYYVTYNIKIIIIKMFFIVN